MSARTAAGAGEADFNEVTMSAVPSPLSTSRAQLLSQLAQNESYDLAIIGGGATGLGVALDAAARGFKVVLVEAMDFAKGCQP